MLSVRADESADAAGAQSVAAGQITLASSATQTEAQPAASDTGIRALFVLPSLALGGSETKTVRLVNALRMHGVNAGVAYLNPPDDLRVGLDPAVPVWHLERRGKVSWAALAALR